MDRKLLFQLLTLFAVTQVLGLVVTFNLIQLNVQTTIVTDNPEDVQNSIGLIAYILFFTAFLLVAMKFFKGKKLFKLFEVLAVFSTGFIVIGVLLPELALMFSLLLVLTRIFLPENMLLKNIASTIAVAGAGSLIGVSLGVLPIIVFVVLLSAYDLIAVFGTKHMVTLAKEISTENLSFTYSLPAKDHVFQLGTGDLVIPLVFSASVLKRNVLALMPFNEAMILPVALLVASIIGLALTLDYCDRKRIALPALPLQAALMLIVYFAASIV